MAAGLVLCGVSLADAQEELSYYAQRAQRLLWTGEYADAEEYCERVLEYGNPDPGVVKVLIEAETAQGKYEEAATHAAKAAGQFEGYVPIQLVVIEALRRAGRKEDAAAALKDLDALARKLNPKTLNAVELVALGKAALLLGAEPKMVLANFFQKARQMDAELLDGHLAAAELALSKADYALASRILQEGRGKVGSFPDLLYLLARSFSPSDRGKADELLTELLELNARHVPALLLRAEHALDNEDYDLAREILATTRETNPHHPEGWAFEAAIAFLLDDQEAGEKARREALSSWSDNPLVDHRIGQKLSQNRRFAEGSQFLRQALEKDPAYLPARKELGQNLLRLGKDDEGWALIKEVQAKDAYDVETYNLMLLHDLLQSFVVLEGNGFVVRMTEKEAAAYGPRVLELLNQANDVLAKKYGYVPPERVVVDFFPNQQDFAIRTLGFPGGLGILGACFGNVIAMNSPGGQGAMGTNWESTLWHEYCHTITLGATNNRIPRWLTEGISVYEERTRDAACGHKMNPAFRRRILEEDEEKPGLIPIEKLSAALTAFSDPATIDFAYYQSSLLVEYLLAEFGKDRFQEVLEDLRENAEAEKVLARRMADLATLDAGFASFARKRAREVAEDADWEVPDPDSPLHRDPEGVASYLEDHPDNIWALSTHCRFLLADQKWEKAKAPARKLIDLFPGYVGAGNGYAYLAMACRNLEQTEEERATLREWVQRDGDAADALDRLIELDLAAEDWAAVQDDARRLLAVNPLLRSPHRALGVAAQELADSASAIRSFESLLHLDPVNPADVHFRLGQLYREEDAPKAKRHVLTAIEEAPRFREAHELLLALRPNEPDAPAPPDPTPAP